MKILILLTPLFLFALTANSINKDSLKLNTNIEFNLRTSMLPLLLVNTVTKPLCLAYGIGFVYSKPIKKSTNEYK